MNVFVNLPPVLQHLVLEYETLAELIEAGVPLFHITLTHIVHSTLGEAVLVESSIDCSGTPLTESHSEGCTALLLLGRFNKACSRTSYHEYLIRQSRTFNQIVYPVLISLLRQMDVSTWDKIVSSLGFLESGVSPDNSGLELLYDLIQSEVLSCVSMHRLITANPGFILNHIHEIGVTELCVYGAIKADNPVLAEAFVQRLACEDNIFLVKSSVSLVYEDLTRLKTLYICLHGKAPSLCPLLQDAIKLYERRLNIRST